MRAASGRTSASVVTHQVNITALTGAVPAPGEAFVVRPAAGGRWNVVATLPP